MINTIIKASAGSGKTFRLSNRFLSILLASREEMPIDSMLATTFTRKAAGEILDRILQRLAAAALDSDICKRLKMELADDLPSFLQQNGEIRLLSHSEIVTTKIAAKETANHQNIEIVNAETVNSDDEFQIDEMVSEQNLLHILDHLAKNLYRLQIGTLDSFFNKIASSFSLELGLPPGWTMLDDSIFPRLVAKAVRESLAASHRHDADHLRHLLEQGEPSRSVVTELIDLTKSWLPLVRETKPEVWDNTILLRNELSESQITDALARLEVASVPMNKTKPSKPNANFEKAKEKIAIQIEKGEWKEFLCGSSLVTSIAASGDRNSDSFSAPLQYYKIDVPDDLHDAIWKLIEHAGAVEINKIVGLTRSTRQLLELILEKYDEISIREGVFRFEDITERLARHFFDLKSLSHRLNSTTEHLLLDEFQDTSMAQANIIRPFIVQAAEKTTGSFFCVGDVKQAIYGWRGGEAQIFDTIEKWIPQNNQPESLNKSYRSSPVIMDVVNRLFESILHCPALNKYKDAATAWQERFSLHESAKTELPGYCCLEEVIFDTETDDENSAEFSDQSNESDNASEEEVLSTNEVQMRRYTADRVAKLHKSRPGKRIGVLVTKNKWIGPLIAELKRRGIDASEEGGNPLTDSAAVLHILSAMILADHPGDRTALFHLSTGPLAKELKLEHIDFSSDFQAIKKGVEQAANVSFYIRNELLTRGYGQVVEKWGRILSTACNPREFQRLEKLIELSYQFQATSHGTRTRAFVDFIKTTKVESPSSANVRVMTIHGSKGLEFDIVVLPDLEGKLEKQTPKLILYRNSPDEPVKFVLRYIPAELQVLLPEEYRNAFVQRTNRDVEESLSVLYVAMTRAINELIMIVQPLSKTARVKQKSNKYEYSATFSGVLRSELVARSADSDELLQQNCDVNCDANGDTNNEMDILQQEYLPDKNEIKSVVLFENGDQNWYSEQKIEEQKLKSQQKEDIKSNMPSTLICKLASCSTKPPRNLLRIAPSSLERQISSKNFDTEQDELSFQKLSPPEFYLHSDSLYHDFIKESVFNENPISIECAQTELDKTERCQTEFDKTKSYKTEQIQIAKKGLFSTSAPRSREEAMLWGTAIHACFDYVLSKIEWLDQPRIALNQIDKKAVCDAISRIISTQKKVEIDVNLVVERFWNIIQNPSIEKVLSKLNYRIGPNQSLEVEHERRFSTRLTDKDQAKIVHGSIDRLVVIREGNTVVGLDVIDYKTDRPMFLCEDEASDEMSIDAFVRNRSEIYRPQLESYREGMAQLFRVDKKMISSHLLFVELDRVVLI
ncbi:MAG: UvrD-helicase domain-containing protein [Thermoguttaceae bacterium]